MNEHQQLALDDIEAFVHCLGEPFEAGEPIAVARAPGRLDVMGGIADYSGSLVLEMPIREATLVAAQRAAGGLTVESRLTGGEVRRAAMSPSQWRDFLAADYTTNRQQLTDRGEAAWLAYVAGPLYVMARELGADMSRGMHIVVESNVPEAKGVSSSAAIEVATLRAVDELVETRLTGTELARLGQLAENRLAGAPCGIMDQMTSALGRADELFALRCQPAKVEGFVPIPGGLHFWGIDSGIRHAVSGSDYGSVRTAAFMGYRILADATNLPVTVGHSPGQVAIEDSRWDGYLANIAPDEFDRDYGKLLPERMRGAEFLHRFSGITDATTEVDPLAEYPVRAATAHPVFECQRVERFGELLMQQLPNDLGELMYASHGSYTACGLGSAGTDRLVELVREAGPECGLFGAKITGGGSGGTVAVLGDDRSGSTITRIAQQYANETGQQPYIFAGSSHGACLVEPRIVKR